MPTTNDLAAHALADSIDQFAKLRVLAEGALAQVDDQAFFAVPAAEANSIAHIVKHMAGNARSRWTHFMTSDGEKPDRDRDREFEITPADTRPALMAAWDAGWSALDAALAPLGPDDLMRTVPIRGEPHTVLRAIHRQIAHYGYHVGQIVLLARQARGAAWTSLSVPKGQSARFNEEVAQRFREKN